MRPKIRLFLAFILITLVAVSCGGSKQGKGKGHRPPSGPVALPKKIPANLLPTLTVGVDSCYVFLQPDGDSPFFGPLVKGELVKRVDAAGRWTLVWIPRLRISGWVRKSQVYRVDKETSEEDTVSKQYLTVLNILKRRVNIRKAPTTRARIIFKAKQRQEFLMLDEKGGWYQVWIPPLKQKGWVSAKIVVKQRRK